MKKVLFYTSGVGLGGVERVLLEILKKIDTQKLDIKVALQYGNENQFESEIPSNISYEYMLSREEIEKTLNIRKKRDIFSRIRYSLRLIYEKNQIKKNFLKYSSDRDIIVDFKSGDFSKLIFKNEKSEKMIWLHCSIKKLNRFEERREKIYSNLKRADKIICICREMREELLQEFDLDERKIVTIYNGLDFEKILKKSQEEENLTQQEKNYLKENYIVMVSRLEEKQKDFSTLFKAFSKIEKIKPNLKLYIVGDGPDRSSLERKIAELGLKDKIILLGRKDNPFIWMKNAKVLVHSSLFEGFGLVLVEGLMLKKYIVSTDFKTGAREILEDGRLGKIVPIGDSDKMAAEISKLLEGDAELTENLKNADLGKYEINETIKQVENLLSQ